MFLVALLSVQARARGIAEFRVRTSAMKRPAAAASRKHVRKGTLKKPAAAPVASDIPQP